MTKLENWLNKILDPYNPAGLAPWMYGNLRNSVMSDSLETLGNFEITETMQTKYLKHRYHRIQTQCVRGEIYLRKISTYRSILAYIYRNYIDFDKALAPYLNQFKTEELVADGLMMFDHKVFDLEEATEWQGYPRNTYVLYKLDHYAVKGALFPARYGDMVDNLAFKGSYLLVHNFDLYSVSAEGKTFKVGFLPDYRGMENFDLAIPDNFCAWFIARTKRINLPKNVDLVFTKALLKVMGSAA